MCDNIKVAIKVRPLIRRETETGLTPQWQIKGNSIACIDSNSYSEPYCFDHIFDETKSTQSVFEIIAKPIIQNCMNGINGTIIAFGQTSSGKTHTMTGTNTEMGVIPLSIYHIFHQIESMSLEREFLLRIAYIEIYNEKIFNLLDGNLSELKIRDMQNIGETTVKNHEIIVDSPETILRYLAEGNAAKRMDETNMNERSSRSHTIFRITIESCAHDEGVVQISDLNLVDLAGSERADQIGIKNERLKETAFLSRSLFSLGFVIKQLSEKGPDTFINYRDSKLTRTLKASLGGNSMTSIICTITPATVEETNYTLLFAMSAKTVKNKPIINKTVSEAAARRCLQNEISRLKNELQNSKYCIEELEREKRFVSSFLMQPINKARRPTDLFKLPSNLGSLEYKHEIICDLRPLEDNLSLGKHLFSTNYIATNLNQSLIEFESMQDKFEQIWAYKTGICDLMETTFEQNRIELQNTITELQQIDENRLHPKPVHYNQLEEENQKLIHQLNNLMEQQFTSDLIINGLRLKIQQIELAHTDLEGEKFGLINEITNLKGDLMNLYEKLNNFTDQPRVTDKSLIQNIDSLTVTISILKERNEELESEISNIWNECKELKISNNDFKSELECLEFEKINLKRTLDETKSYIVNQLKPQLNFVKSEYENLQNTLNDLLDQNIASLTENMTTLRTKNAELDQAIETLRFCEEKTTGFEKKYAALTMDNKILENKVMNLNMEVENYQQEMTVTQDQFKRVNKQTEENHNKLQAKINEIQESRTEMETKLANTNQKLELYKWYLLEVEATKSLKLESVRQLYEMKYNELEHSKSILEAELLQQINSIQIENNELRQSEQNLTIEKNTLQNMLTEMTINKSGLEEKYDKLQNSCCVQIPEESQIQLKRLKKYSVASRSKLLNDNSDLKKINETLFLELDNIKRHKYERKSKRSITYDKNRGALLMEPKKIETPVDPSNSNCRCNIMEERVKDLKRENCIKDFQIKNYQITENNLDTLNMECLELREKLTLCENKMIELEWQKSSTNTDVLMSPSIKHSIQTMDRLIQTEFILNNGSDDELHTAIRTLEAEIDRFAYNMTNESV